tara:strand:+ start:570 stop:1442 length:873 start_codon:yes stop_codon:yes gene_type:complete
MALQDSGLLVGLKITQWTARKLDRSTSFEVCDTKSADQGSASVHKRIIPAKYLKNVNQVVDKARAYHYANTLPWTHKGVDLLPSRNYMRYTQTMGELEDEFNAAADEFVTAYPTIIAQVENNLNGLYNAADYPTAEAIRKRFTMEFEMTPVPESGDFRVDIGKKELNRLKDKLADQLVAAEAAAQQDLYSRLYTALAKAVMTLKTPGKIFRNTLIFNIETIAEQVPRLNVAGDEALDDLADQILHYSKDTDIELLRGSKEKNNKYRETTAGGFEDYLNKVEAHYESTNAS